jgi:hypothetical protein
MAIFVPIFFFAYPSSVSDLYSQESSCKVAARRTKVASTAPASFIS